MTESIEQMMANGAGFPAPTPDVSPGGFDSGAGWDSHWTFRDAQGQVTAEGDIPMPSQTKIDNFQRTIAKLFVDLDEAARKENEARDPEAERTAEQRMAEIDEALKLKHEVMGKFCDALANVCSDSPNRKQLKGLNEPQLFRFIEFVGGLLNPNV